MTALFEGLVDEHPTDDTQVAPGVATHWESLDGATRWIFHLRKEAKWSDGTALTAHDFVASYQRELSPTFGALYAEMLYKLKNAEDYHQAKNGVTDFASVGAKALDDHTLELTLNGPMPYFLLVLTHFTWFPVPLHVIRKYGKLVTGVGSEREAEESRFNKWIRAGNMVGNGAFQLKTWAFKDYVAVERNPHYWDAAAVQLNGVKFMVVTDLATEERMFRNGRLHVTETMPLSRIAHYQSKAPEVLQLRPYLGSYMFRINVTHGPLKDKRVRQALNLSVDRQVLVEKSLHNAHSPAWSYLPPMDGYPQIKPMTLDIPKAQQLLAEAGFPGGKGFPAIEIHVNDSETHVLVAQFLQNAWKEALGVNFSIRQESSSVFYDTQERLDYHISRAGWIADFVEPISFLDMWTKENKNNNTGWENAEYDQLIRDSYAEGDAAKRLAILQKAEAIFEADFVVVPIYWYRRPFLLHPALQGWNQKVLDNHPYKHLSLSTAALPPLE
jgi:oligopeptide transport system substrate-binding protein